MAEHDEKFQSDQQKSGDLPDGKYQAQIVQNLIQESDGEYSLMFRFQTSEGNTRKWYNFDNDIGREIAAKDTKMLGYEGPLSGLQDAVDKDFFIGIICEIATKTKSGEDRDFQNVYINRVLGKGDLPEGGEVAPTGADDDIPF